MINIKVKVELIDQEPVKIYRMSTLDLQENPVMWVSAFLIDGLLIDCGHHHAKELLLKKLDFDEIELCILSHHHEDHYGSARVLMNKYDIPVFASKETAYLIQPKIRIPPERMLVWGIPESCKVNILPNLQEIKTSKTKFKIIPSPGHCNNLISFFHKKEGILFSTDAMIDKKQSVIFYWENANLMLETFKKFKALRPEYLYSSNSNIFSYEDLDHLIEYWINIKEKSAKLHSTGLKPREIVKRVFGKESWLKTSTRGDISRENLIRSLLHLPPIFKKRRMKKTI
ncbi:MAG: MBL fold metallo-hydrolase [Promethearchaeota archaeon]